MNKCIINEYDPKIGRNGSVKSEQVNLESDETRIILKDKKSARP